MTILLLFSISEDGNSFGDNLAANEENSLILMLRERIALFNGFFQVERIGADITLLTIEIHEYDN
jgi:signal transduction histidine kinase